MQMKHELLKNTERWSVKTEGGGERERLIFIYYLLIYNVMNLKNSLLVLMVKNVTHGWVGSLHS